MDRNKRGLLMKKLLAAALLALPLLAAPARAHGLKIMWQVNNGPPIQLGPWYQYWPDAQGNMVGPASSGPWSLERHFEVPAPLGGNPYFPAPAAAYPGYGH